MAVRDLLEIVLSYVQYFLLLVSIAPSPFPSYYQTPFQVLKYLNLDFSSLFQRNGALSGQLPDSWPIDVRLQFIAVSVVLPLLLALTGLLALAPKVFILWYTFLIAAIFLVCIAVFALAIGDPLVIAAVGSTNVFVFLYTGIGGFVVCIASGIGYYFLASGAKDELKNRTYEEIMEEEVGTIPWGNVFFRVVYILICAFFGLLLVGAFEIGVIMAKDRLGIFGLALGSLLLFLAAALLAWTSVGFHRNGRLVQFHIGELVKNNFLSVLLLLISLLYIPAVTNVVLVVNCRDVSCSARQRLPDVGSHVWQPSNATGATCEPCVFAQGQSCGSTLQLALCGSPSTSSRLYVDPTVPCSELEQYFWPASGIMFVSYVLAMPIINFILTSRSTKMLAADFPLDMQESLGLTDAEAFEEKVHASDNVAKFIYDPFQLRWRHWRMLFLFQKLGTVLAASFVISSSNIGSAQVGLDVSAFIHWICMMYIAFTRPFKRKVENFLTIATQFMLTVASSIAVAAVNGATIPDTVWLGTAVAAAALPALSFLLGVALTIRDSNLKREARERRIQKAIDTVEQAEDDAEVDDDDLYGEGADEDDDDDGLTGTLRGLPSEHNMSGKRRKSIHRGALKKIMVKSAEAPKSNNMMQESAVARRKAKVAAANKAGGDGLMSPKPLEMDVVTGTHVFVESDEESPLTKPPEIVTPPNKGLIAPIPGRRGRTEIKITENQIHCGAPPQHTLALGSNVAKPPPKLSAKTTAATATATPAASPRNAANPLLGANPRNAANPLLGPPALPVAPTTNRKRIPNTAAQSKRARARWVQAKMWVLRKVREEMLLREEQDDDDDDDASASQSPSGSDAKQKKKKGKKKKMAGWDKLMVILLKKNAGGGNGNQASTSSPKDNSDLRRMDSNLHAVQSLERQQSLTEDEIKARLREIYEHHMLRVRDQQKAVDFRINDDITGILHIFFMIIGMFAFVALGCCVLGVIRYSQSRYFVEPLDATAVTPTLSNELAGYGSWKQFTDNCCCVAFSNQTHTTESDVEKWLCANGNVKERLRSVTSTTAAGTTAWRSGLAVRPMCSPLFNYACEPTVVNNATREVALNGCVVSLSPDMRYYW